MTSIVGNAGDERIAGLFGQLSQPARIQILLIIREQPACVCHLVAARAAPGGDITAPDGVARSRLGDHQSEQPFYLLSPGRKRLLPMIEAAAQIADISFAEIARISLRPLETCPCPQCHPELTP